jgi:hypothetical protein
MMRLCNTGVFTGLLSSLQKHSLDWPKDSATNVDAYRNKNLQGILFLLQKYQEAMQKLANFGKHVIIFIF